MRASVSEVIRAAVLDVGPDRRSHGCGARWQDCADHGRTVLRRLPRVHHRCVVHTVKSLWLAADRVLGTGHVVPEAFVGGPIALVEDGDKIVIDTVTREINWLVDEEEQKRRREKWSTGRSTACFTGTRDVAVSALRFGCSVRACVGLTSMCAARECRRVP